MHATFVDWLCRVDFLLDEAFDKVNSKVMLSRKVLYIERSWQFLRRDFKLHKASNMDLC